MPEMRGLCDRMIVMRDGRVAAEHAPAGISPETVFAQAVGLDPAPRGAVQ